MRPRDWSRIVQYLRADWSPEQIAGRLRCLGQLRICHATIYNYIWQDRAAGGALCRLLCCAGRRRARYGGRTQRARRILGRPIGDRPASIERRQRVGHWEVDTIAGSGDRAAALTLVERKTGFVLIGAQGAKVRTITADNGSEMVGYRRIERLTGARFYFANPYHAWERGTNENTNALIRQCLPKGQSLGRLTPQDCARIARRHNARPRKRLGYHTPEECYAGTL